ncbi:hypothetical protein F2P81_019486 [Scophthalmus maximus]|uniref:Uncharacterized protein n=1 Tax=Scophthalmus maximus TaxID=52904 RepID=A0A6A4S774_SCOMX|nr:hypothetical protein F2P81_019486 [Scophthalmus maximus]
MSPSLTQDGIIEMQRITKPTWLECSLSLNVLRSLCTSFSQRIGTDVVVVVVSADTTSLKMFTRWKTHDIRNENRIKKERPSTRRVQHSSIFANVGINDGKKSKSEDVTVISNLWKTSGCAVPT